MILTIPLMTSSTLAWLMPHAPAMTTASSATLQTTGPQVFELLQIIQDEYREMPGLSLTPAQMQRLWGLESFVCEALIDALVAARVLRRTPNGAYVAV